jgi:hypothetical protein
VKKPDCGGENEGFLFLCRNCAKTGVNGGGRRDEEERRAVAARRARLLSRAGNVGDHQGRRRSVSQGANVAIVSTLAQNSRGRRLGGATGRQDACHLARLLKRVIMVAGRRIAWTRSSFDWREQSPPIVVCASYPVWHGRANGRQRRWRRILACR